MATPYQYDTRGASHAAQIINLERMVEERDAEIERLRAENERLREALKSAKPVYTTHKNCAAVRSGHVMSGAIKHYIIQPHVLHIALAAKGE